MVYLINIEGFAIEMAFISPLFLKLNTPDLLDSSMYIHNKPNIVGYSLQWSIYCSTPLSVIIQSLDLINWEMQWYISSSYQ